MVGTSNESVPEMAIDVTGLEVPWDIIGKSALINVWFCQVLRPELNPNYIGEVMMQKGFG
jgi:hypothetical protein